MTVVIGWLDNGTTAGDFTECVTRLAAYEVSQGRLATTIRIRTGPQMPEGRNKLVTQFLDTDAEWLFMVDSDMLFNHKIIADLLETADPVSAPFVGGLCFAVNEKFGQYPVLYQNLLGMPAVMFDVPAGIAKVDATGAACTLQHRTLFEKFRRDDPHPWYHHRRVIAFDGKHEGGWLGEDLSWCWHLREQGVPIFVDCDVEIGHVKWGVVNRDTYRPNQNG